MVEPMHDPVPQQNLISIKLVQMTRIFRLTKKVVNPMKSREQKSQDTVKSL